MWIIHGVQPPLFCWAVETPTKFSKRGEGLDRISIFRGGLLGKRKGFFSGGLQFLDTQKKLKSEIFNYKKSL